MPLEIVDGFNLRIAKNVSVEQRLFTCYERSKTVIGKTIFPVLVFHFPRIIPTRPKFPFFVWFFFLSFSFILFSHIFFPSRIKLIVLYSWHIYLNLFLRNSFNCTSTSWRPSNLLLLFPLLSLMHHFSPGSWNFTFVPKLSYLVLLLPYLFFLHKRSTTISQFCFFLCVNFFVAFFAHIVDFEKIL